MTWTTSLHCWFLKKIYFLVIVVQQHCACLKSKFIRYSKESNDSKQSNHSKQSIDTKDLKEFLSQGRRCLLQISKTRKIRKFSKLCCLRCEIPPQCAPWKNSAIFDTFCYGKSHEKSKEYYQQDLNVTQQCGQNWSFSDQPGSFWHSLVGTKSDWSEPTRHPKLVVFQLLSKFAKYRGKGKLF